MNGIQKIAKYQLGQDVDKGSLLLKGLNVNHPKNGDFKITSEYGVINFLKNNNGFWLDAVIAVGELNSTDLEISKSLTLDDSAKIIFSAEPIFESGDSIPYLFKGVSISIDQAGKGVIMKSPDGTQYIVTVTDAGAIDVNAL